MKEAYWLLLKEKLRKEADKLIAESENEYEKYRVTNNSIYYTIARHIDVIVDCFEEALIAIDYFTDLQ